MNLNGTMFVKQGKAVHFQAVLVLFEHEEDTILLTVP